MKGISHALTFILGLIILIFFLLLMMRIFHYNKIVAYDKAAYESAQRIADRINKLCADPGRNEIEVEVTFPQDVRGVWTAMKPIIFPLVFYRKGDPDYLVYYEYFPQIEDEAWTIYIKDQAPYPGLFSFHPNTDFEKELENELRTYFDNPKDVYFLNVNIAANKSLRENYIAAQNVMVNNSRYGIWEGNVFTIFETNLTLPEKVMLKYFPCGTNSICFKLRNEKIYSFPLNECKGKYDYIELSRKVQSKLSPKLWFSPNYWGAYNSRFYLASPCKAKLKIYKGECQCDLSNKETVYMFDNKTKEYKPVGEEFICGKIIAGKKTNPPKFDCLVVDVEDMDGFCYTSPHYFRDMVSSAFGQLAGTSGAVVAASYITSTVTSTAASTACLSNPVGWVVCPVAAVYGIYETRAQKWKWRWPSHPS